MVQVTIQILRNQQGMVGPKMAIYTLLIIFCLFVMTDFAFLYHVKSELQDSIDNSAVGALVLATDEDLFNHRLILDDEAAEDAFYRLLQMNLNVNRSLWPQTGSLLNGPVNINELRFEIGDDGIPRCYVHATAESKTMIVGMFSQSTATVSVRNLAVAATQWK